MDKKEIYEHLAKIYLDASSKSSKKKKKIKENQKFRNLFFASTGIIFVLSIFLFLNFYTHKSINPSYVALVLAADPVKINFNFDPACKEVYSINLNRLNLGNYKALAFSVKKSNYLDNISLRVDFVNSFNERSFLYVRDIPHKWNDYKINFAEFKNISDWSEMSDLAFTVEEWNAKDKRDVVLIDNVRVLR